MVNLFTILLTIGIKIREVGRLTAKPTANARSHISKKLGTNPKFIIVRTKDMEKDMPSDINTPNKIVAYFISIFKVMVTISTLV